jgi:Family of unknown function (DUF6304)
MKSPNTASYLARYQDSFGKEGTTIINDGEALTIMLRGVRFRGSDFDCFKPQDVVDSAKLSSFKFRHGSLCFCLIEADIPIPVVTPGQILDCLLRIFLELGDPLPTGQMNQERLKLCLKVNEQTYSSEGKTGWFEGEMLNLQSKLPPGTFMKACINCAFSDYSPYGHGLFGNMICFRANKVGYRFLPLGEDFDKDDYFDVMDTVSEMVQETQLCPEFERRVPGTGYRG